MNCKNELKMSDEGCFIYNKLGNTEIKTLKEMHYIDEDKYKYKLIFEKNKNKVFFKNFNFFREKETTLKDLLSFIKQINSILISSSVTDIIASSVINEKLEIFLKKIGFKESEQNKESLNIPPKGSVLLDGMSQKDFINTVLIFNKTKNYHKKI